MKLDETTLIEIQDYIDALDEKVGLKPETVEDVRKAIDRYRTELKNLRLVAVSGRSEQLANFCTCKKPWGVNGICVVCEMQIKIG